MTIIHQRGEKMKKSFMGKISGRVVSADAGGEKRIISS